MSAVRVQVRLPGMEYNHPPAYCPGCRGPLGPVAEHEPAQGHEQEQGNGQEQGNRQGHGPAACPHCALPLTGEGYGEVRRIDAELAGLEQRRAALHGRRQALVAELRAAASGGAASGGAAQGTAPGWAPWPGVQGPGHWAPGHRPWGAGRAETSSYTARNVLLVLGGVLLTVAAFAFTLLSWGDMGVGGRAAVLGGLTLGTLAVPVALLRRKLTATAESVAGFGLVLLALNAYALREVLFPYVDGLGYSASSAALIAALWAGYGLALPAPGLRLVLPFAVVVAQLPLPLWALSLDGASDRTAYGFAVALLLTFAADVALAVSRQLGGKGARVTGRPVRLTAAVAGVPVGVLMTGVTLWQPYDGIAAARWNALQAVAAAVLLYAGRRHAARRLAVPLGTVAGLVLVTALGGVAWAVVRTVSTEGIPGWDWRVLVYLLCAAGLLGAVPALRVTRASQAPGKPGMSGTQGTPEIPETPGSPGTPGTPGTPEISETPGSPGSPGERQKAGLVAAAVVVQCGALAWALVPVADAVAGPWSFVTRIWEGPPDGPVGQAVDTGYAWSGSPAVPLVLLLLALSVPLLAGALRAAGRGRPAHDGAAEDGTAPDAAAPDRTAHAGRRPGFGGTSSRLWAGRSPAGELPVLPAATALCAAAGATAPLALGLPYWPAMAVVAALATVLLVAAAKVADAATGVTALASGLTLAGTATGWALAQQSATLGVLTLLCVASAASAAWSPKDHPGRRAAPAAAAVAYAAGLAGALAAALDLPAHQASFAVLAVAVGTVPAAALLARGAVATDTPARGAVATDTPARAPAPPKAVSLAVECTGYAAAFAALLLCVPHPDTLWLALALCAASAAGVAVRADRRNGAARASAVLLILATWVRLFASDVSTPEAYTLPVSAALLLAGWLRRRRVGDGKAPAQKKQAAQPGQPMRAAQVRVSSWVAYGGGLTFTFLPSLIAMASDPHWLRPLLLGAGALGTTLAGARWRAQAPLLLGGATLAAVGVHELAPYVVQVAWLLPRWLVPALAGLLLVVVGATYERRLAEARRLKRAWQRLS